MIAGTDRALVQTKAVQAYFRDSVDSVPDHWKKVNIAIEEVNFFLVSQCI